MSSHQGQQAQPIHFYPPKQSLRYGIRETAGRHNRYRWAVVALTQVLFYGLCWLQWQGNPVLRFDFERQQIHWMGSLFGPQDLLVLALLMIGGALALFAVSTLAGRLFCGFACPQSVYTTMFMWIEQRLQGSPGQRQRRAKTGQWLQSGLRTAATWGTWGLLSLWTGWTLAAYFTPAPELWARTLSADLGFWELFSIFFYGGFMMVQAGWLREKVCQHMCPYARFQGVMGNSHTLNVSYDQQRGEPRTVMAKRTPATAAACIDCGLCVDVCPVGIDIRNGPQYECIGCGLCIDACDRVMTGLRQPTGLIRWASASGRSWRTVWWQPRVAVYAGLLGVALLAVLLLSLTRIPLQVDVLRDRNVLSRITRDGHVENAYRLHLQNYDTVAHRYTIRVEGLPDLRLLTPPDTLVAAGSERTLVVTVLAPANDNALSVNPLQFTVQASDSPEQQRTRASTLLFPR